VQCAVGSSVFQYAFVGSNPYYIKLQITNTRCAAGVYTALFFFLLGAVQMGYSPAAHDDHHADMPTSVQYLTCRLALSVIT